MSLTELAGCVVSPAERAATSHHARVLRAGGQGSAETNHDESRFGCRAVSCEPPSWPVVTSPAVGQVTRECRCESCPWRRHSMRTRSRQARCIRVRRRPVSAAELAGSVIAPTEQPTVGVNGAGMRVASGYVGPLVGVCAARAGESSRAVVPFQAAPELFQPPSRAAARLEPAGELEPCGDVEPVGGLDPSRRG